MPRGIASSNHLSIMDKVLSAYCGTYQNATVLDRDGRVADRMILDGPCPTNLAFSQDGKRIPVTEVAKGQVEILEAPCVGQALNYPIAR